MTEISFIVIMTLVYDYFSTHDPKYCYVIQDSSEFDKGFVPAVGKSPLMRMCLR